MGDILILFGSQPGASKGRSVLVSRPGMHQHQIHEFTLPWGGAVVQESKGNRYAPAQHAGRTIIPIGRPIVRGEQLGDAPDAFARWVLGRSASGTLAQSATEISEAISGMYAIFEIDEEQVTVLTDHMGFRPVYVARDHTKRILGLGTHVESLAAATGQLNEIDLVSLGELFTHNSITFPYTTRTTIQELDPCSITRCRPGDETLTTDVLWEPSEPEVFPEESEMRQALREALLEAGDDLTRGCERVGVLLSGGFDSRVVLGVLGSERVRAALTYMTRENRETRVAGEVARSAGIDQLLVQRDKDYFPNLVERGLELIGMELRGNCHGLCIADNGLEGSFDVIIGGQLSDTLLKDHYMPLPKRQSLRSRSMRSLLRTLIKGSPPTPTPSSSHTTGRGVLEEELTPQIRDQVRQRRADRLRVVERVRPTTADEWHRFWPCSRQDDSAHTLGNTRLMCADTLFAHQAIVEVSRNLAPKLRVDGRLADAVFIDLCGALGRIVNANTGLPADAPRKAIRAKRERDRKHRMMEQPSRSDWNDVETSWVDPVTMQQRSEIWTKNRARLVSSPAIELLSEVIDRGAQEMIGSYQPDLPSTSNHIAMQLAIWLDRIGARHPTAASEATG